jgi:DNA repair photolyase
MPRDQLIGIARLAHAAPELQRKNFATYSQLPSFKLLNKCDSARVPFDWTVNPYRGCEFGCVYCYARYTHEFMELRDPMDFETRIFAKQWNPAAFREDLRRIDPSESIAIGTATDPYQPAERRYGLTRSILGVLAGETPRGGGRRIWITTKSDLVSRDIDLLTRLGQQGHRVTVNITVTTVDTELARKLEPRAPRPDLRLRAVSELARAGIPVGISCAPILPLINDRRPQMEALAQAAAGAGAQWMWGGPVFLSNSTRPVFFAFLEREFPQLLAKYRQHFGSAVYLRGEYPRQIKERLAEIRARHGLQGQGQDEEGWEQQRRQTGDGVQMSLEF